MRKTNLLSILSIVVCLLAEVSAVNISLTVSGLEAVEDSAGNFLGTGNTVLVGSFDTGFDVTSNATNFATLLANFGSFDDFGIFDAATNMLSGATADAGVFSGSFNLSSTTVPDAGGTTPDVYVWFFNNATPASADEYAIINLGALANGVSPTGTSQSLDLSAFQAAEHGSYNPSATSTGALGVVTLEAVPEPSAYAAIAGLLALTWVMARRR
jgi:hypothetical protein